MLFSKLPTSKPSVYLTYCSSLNIIVFDAASLEAWKLKSISLIIIRMVIYVTDTTDAINTNLLAQYLMV
jgi:hypothetical protein